MPKSTLSNPRGVRGAASLCAVAALAYLFVQDLLTIFVSALMGMRVQGASLSDPVGFSVAAQGLLGIVVSLIALVPITSLIQNLSGIADLQAKLPLGYSLLLIAISIAITVVGGLIPARKAAKKDPVIALRTE